MRHVLTRLWPRSLVGRTTLVLLTSLLALHLGSVWVHEASLRGTDRAARERALREGLMQAVRALADLPDDARDRAAHALSTPALELHWRQGQPSQGEAVLDSDLDALRVRLVGTSSEIAPLRLAWGDGERHLVVGALPIGDTGSISFAAPLFRAGHGELFDRGALVSLVAMAVGIGIASVFVVRGMTKPLRDLSGAADRIGRETDRVRMPEDGPSEVRQAARAFNAMQDRIQRLVEDRTQALAAVSHDLRTPITRIRLRAGFLDDPLARDRIDADLDEMEAMVNATLAYLQGERDEEPARRADLAAMLRTLVDDATDAGHRATYEGPAKAELLCRPLSLKRAFANLLDNAVKYGGGAQVILHDDPAGVTVLVQDNGPGIPDEAMEVVFEPFRRLETSRNRGTGGTGLGLTIARRIAGRHGGTVALRNRPEGGLEARMRLVRDSCAGQ